MTELFLMNRVRERKHPYKARVKLKFFNIYFLDNLVGNPILSGWILLTEYFKNMIEFF